MHVLPDPLCELGYTIDQVKEVLKDRYPEFERWMQHQTVALCDGREYDHKTKTFSPACNGVAHGAIIYRGDLMRFIEDRPIID